MSFISTAEISFLQPLKAHWQAIRAEYDGMAAASIQWPEPIHNGKWNVLGLCFQGKDMVENKKRAPLTSSLCEAIPGIQTYGFSIMEPGCEIQPHVGYTNQVLRGHLGLYSNPAAALKIGEEVCHWKEGEVFVFDDTILHSAWNRGTTTRVILLFDFLI